MAKKKQSMDFGIAQDLMPPLAFAGLGMGSLTLGSAFESHIPSGVSNPLTTTGSTIASFAAPVATIAAGGIVFKQMKKLEDQLKNA